MTPATADPGPTPTPQSAPHPWGRRATPPPSSDGLLSSGLRYGILAIYVGTVYVIVVALGGVGRDRLTPPWWLTLVALLIIWVRVAWPRLREDQLQSLAWKVLVPVALAQLVLTTVIAVVVA